MIKEIALPVIKRQDQGNTGVFEIGPIASYLSLPLANAIRRVSLSSLPGAAITSIRIKGVQHEFQDIEHVKEDVPDIVQNLKKVRLRSFSDRTVTVYLDVQGERIVRASDIEVPGMIEVVNPEAHIATLDNEGAHLEIQMMVETGRGFVAFDAQTTEPTPIGTILIDAIYSPVLHVSYTIEPVREHQGDLHTITLEITTDGAISPDEALREAALILREQFAVLSRGKYERDKSAPSAHASGVPIPPGIYALPLADLGLSVRTYNAFKRASIRTAGELLEREERDILDMKNVGERALEELCDSFQKLGVLPGEQP